MNGERTRGRAATVSAIALVPLRLFLGGTFLFAGFDKLLDPRFFDPASAASIQSQMLAFTRISPIGGLVRLGQPWAVPIGVAIALAEIAIGLGTLTGLAFRLVAWAGVGLSALFFLTASWSTRPFYYGPDLPFLFGWLALALAGHGGVLVSHRLLEWVGSPTRPAAGAADGAVDSVAPGATLALRDRRSVLQAGVVGLLALVAASLSVPFRSVAALRDATDGEPGDRPTPSAGGSPIATSSTGAVGGVVATTADVARTGARAFTVPFTAPAPLPAGDPAVIVRLMDGSFVAFDAVCTHAGCRVEWDATDHLLVCPCHGAVFDPAHGAAVLEGPTAEPLAPIPIAVDGATGEIRLVG